MMWSRKRISKNKIKNPWKINSRKITRLKTKLREWLSKRLREKNLLRNMIVGNKEIRRNRKKRKQIQERRIKNLTLITSVIELALLNLKGIQEYKGTRLKRIK